MKSSLLFFRSCVLPSLWHAVCTFWASPSSLTVYCAQIQRKKYRGTYKTYTASSTVYLCVFCPRAIHDISKCLVIWLHTPWPPHETASSVGCKVFCLIVEVLNRTLCLRQNDDVCDGSGMSLHRCNVIGCTNAGGGGYHHNHLHYCAINTVL